jgi:hypothetical protein
MADDVELRPELARILARFPQLRRLIRRRYLADQAFRGACEDYRLACEGLATFEGLATAAPRSEVEDYRRLVRELEAEILAMVTGVDGAPRHSGQ